MDERESEIRDNVNYDNKLRSNLNLIYIIGLLDEARKRISLLEGSLIKTPDELHVLSKKVENMGFGKREE